MKVKIPLNFRRKLEEAVDTNLEVAGFILFLLEKDYFPFDGELETYKENACHITTISSSLLKLAVDNPRKLELFLMHSHSRKYGDRVKEYDPYWTITTDDGDFNPGEIVEGRFYVSRHETIEGKRISDASCLNYFNKVLKAEYGISFNKGLFLHPEYGSEGTIMTPEKVSITAYEFDPSSKFSVREIPVEEM